MMSSISLAEAADILQSQLGYDSAKAEHYVKQFDRNNDGQLCAAEFDRFKTTVRDTLEELKAKFIKYDVDNNGLVSFNEAKAVLAQPPFSFNEEKVKLLLERFDKDGNGQLDLNEFAGFYSEAKAINEDIGRRFDALDTDKNGLLSPNELVGVICKTLSCDETKARQFVSSFDQNNDGYIDKSEFVGMWSIMFG